MYYIQYKNAQSFGLGTTKQMNSSVDNINISNLSDGVYLITIENGSSKTTKKIVLNR